jgi:hypothetical protein
MKASYSKQNVATRDEDNVNTFDGTLKKNKKKTGDLILWKTKS